MRRVQADDINYSTRHAGGVVRYHAWPTVREQLIEGHTWQVMRIFLEIFGLPRAEVLAYIHQHDQKEIGSGDNPYHVKKQYPELKRVLDQIEDDVTELMSLPTWTITDEERARFKFCDVLEMFEFGHVECMMGNRYAEPIVERTGADLAERMKSLSDAEIVAVRKYIVRHRLPHFRQETPDDRD